MEVLLKVANYLIVKRFFSSKKNPALGGINSLLISWETLIENLFVDCSGGSCDLYDINTIWLIQLNPVQSGL